MIYPNWHYTSPCLASSITIQMGWASEQIPTRWMMWGWSNCCMITAIRAGHPCSHAITWLHYKTSQHMATMNLILVFGINLRRPYVNLVFILETDLANPINQCLVYIKSKVSLQFQTPPLLLYKKSKYNIVDFKVIL